MEASIIVEPVSVQEQFSVSSLAAKSLSNDQTLQVPFSTPLKGSSNVSEARWSIWANDKPRTDAVSLLAPGTPEILARVQSVLTSPNGQEESAKGNHSTIMQLFGSVFESESCEETCSTGSSFYSSDEDSSFIESPGRLPLNSHLFGRPGPLHSLEPRKFCSAAELCEPASLPPQLAYPLDKRSYHQNNNIPNTHLTNQQAMHGSLASHSLTQNQISQHFGLGPSHSQVNSFPTKYGSWDFEMPSNKLSYTDHYQSNNRSHDDLNENSYEAKSDYPSTQSSSNYGHFRSMSASASMRDSQSSQSIVASKTRAHYRQRSDSSLGSQNGDDMSSGDGGGYSSGYLSSSPSSSSSSSSYSSQQSYSSMYQNTSNNFYGNDHFLPQANPPFHLNQGAPQYMHHNIPLNVNNHYVGYNMYGLHHPQQHQYYGYHNPSVGQYLPNYHNGQQTQQIPSASFGAAAYNVHSAPLNVPAHSQQHQPHLHQPAHPQQQQYLQQQQPQHQQQHQPRHQQNTGHSVSKPLIRVPSSPRMRGRTTSIESNNSNVSKSDSDSCPCAPKVPKLAWDNVKSVKAYVPAGLSSAESTTKLSSSVASAPSASHVEQPVQPATSVSITEVPRSSKSSKNASSPRSKETLESLLLRMKEMSEKLGFEDVQFFALSHVQSLPRSCHPKLCLELADMAKRENFLIQSRMYYQVANKLNPYDAKAWLEWAKMEEESGNLDLCERILAEGLHHCGSNSESLVLRYVRVLTARDKIQEARTLIGKMLVTSSQSALTDTVAPTTNQSGTSNDVREWRIVLEGAMLEWRAGRTQLAHSILKHLQTSMPGRTQPYMYSANLYKREEKFMDAYNCILEGLHHLPNAGMLWFEALQLQEQLLSSKQVASTFSEKESSKNDVHSQKLMSSKHKPTQPVQQPKSHQNKNRRPKYQEKQTSAAPQVVPTNTTVAPHETMFGPWPSNVEQYYDSYLPRFVQKALANLSPELTWKFHLELAALHERRGSEFLDLARKSCALSAQTCPSNLLWRVWLAGGRLELTNGSETIARRLLVKAAKSVPKKMQSSVLLEYARLEEYLGNIDKARYILTKAKRDAKFEWKVFLENILLEMRSGNVEAAIAETRAALEAHPNTGRLWAVLIQVHHFYHYNEFESHPQSGRASIGFEKTKAVFDEALKEVPKSGEVWCEGARLALHAGRLEEARRYLSFAVELTPQYGDTTIEFLRLEMLEQERQKSDPLEDQSRRRANDRLAQLCIHSDPNYGPIWTFCKELSHDPCSTTMNAAREMLMQIKKEDPSLDLAYHILGKKITDSNIPAKDRRKLIFN